MKCAVTDLGIQWAGWALAAAFRTEKFYDLAGNVKQSEDTCRLVLYSHLTGANRKVNHIRATREAVDFLYLKDYYIIILYMSCIHVLKCHYYKNLCYLKQLCCETARELLPHLIIDPISLTKSPCVSRGVESNLSAPFLGLFVGPNGELTSPVSPLVICAM